MRFEFIGAEQAYLMMRQLCGTYVGRSGDQIENVQMAQVRYFFTGAVALAGLVTIPGFHPACFRRNRMYVRTGGGVAEVKSALVRLSSQQFVPVHQSIVVSLREWTHLDVRERGFIFTAPGQAREWVPISKRLYRSVRAAVGLSIRQGPWNGSPPNHTPVASEKPSRTVTRPSRAPVKLVSPTRRKWPNRLLKGSG